MMKDSLQLWTLKSGSCFCTLVPVVVAGCIAKKPHRSDCKRCRRNLPQNRSLYPRCDQSHPRGSFISERGTDTHLTSKQLFQICTTIAHAHTHICRLHPHFTAASLPSCCHGNAALVPVSHLQHMLPLKKKKKTSQQGSENINKT